MKECFTSNEIAHIWANQDTSGITHGRVSGGSMSFDGGAFKSYQTVIGNIIRYKGKKAFVLDRESFSVTTSKQQSKLSRAIPGLDQVFHVHCGRLGQYLDFTPQTLRDYYLAKFKDTGEPHKIAHVNANQIISRESSLGLALEVCHFFSLPTAAILNMQKRFQSQVIHARIILENRKQKLESTAAKREQNQRIKNTTLAVEKCNLVLSGAADMDDVYFNPDFLPPDLREKWNVALVGHEALKIRRWLAGENVTLGHSLPAILRREADEIVTSKGARIPVAEGEKAFRFAVAVLAKRPEGWHRNGETFKVGDYQLDAINAQGIVAGCHRIGWSEIERFAKAEGWV